MIHFKLEHLALNIRMTNPIESAFCNSRATNFTQKGLCFKKNKHFNAIYAIIKMLKSAQKG